MAEPVLSTHSTDFGRLRDAVAAAPARALRAWRAGVRAIVHSVYPDESEAWLVEAELDLYRHSTRHSALLLPIGAFIIAEASEPWISRATRLGWWIAVLAICLGLETCGRILEKRPPQTLGDLRRRAMIYGAMNVVFMLTWCSMSVFLWAPGQPLNHMMLILILACSLAGSITMSAVHPAAVTTVFVTHAIFIVGPLALSPATLDQTLAGLATIFILLMAGQAVALN